MCICVCVWGWTGSQRTTLSVTPRVLSTFKTGPLIGWGLNILSYISWRRARDPPLPPPAVEVHTTLPLRLVITTDILGTALGSAWSHSNHLAGWSISSASTFENIKLWAEEIAQLVKARLTKHKIYPIAFTIWPQSLKEYVTKNRNQSAKWFWNGWGCRGER